MTSTGDGYFIEDIKGIDRKRELILGLNE